MRALVLQLRWLRRVKKSGITGRFSLSLCLLGIACSCSEEARFPAVDYSKLRITLTRSACFGSCPDYQVIVRGTGDVDFSTLEKPIDESSDLYRQSSPSVGVKIPGRHHARIDRTHIDALLEKFRAANFFALRGEYRWRVTDNPTYTIAIDTGHGSKQVIDYVGQQDGMPKAVTEIENAVDTAADTKRWIKGT